MTFHLRMEVLLEINGSRKELRDELVFEVEKEMGVDGVLVHIFLSTWRTFRNKNRVHFAKMVG